MAKIKVKNPIVEMDGDEMTRIIWQWIRERSPAVSGRRPQVLRPSVREARRTGRQITNPIPPMPPGQYGGRQSNAPPSTPGRKLASREFGLKKKCGRVPRTIRNILDGTIFREPIVCRNVPR